ncbi:DUF6279 family lipoprotein [Pseudoalteromonas luteoviolacea]|uniref:Lipoprotein n=1 Tax=Pseudoalteromonas luteoviolacea S4060-1 TaxID=1365257 RepID=A0A161Z0H7_9GAMM|nr:DUF6279 family lipoprotein [Pseudoalteromonas luteoviolacea]KZN69280.1 hypothetical protein N478_11650 [Pseudoalteromonas luteoviolacea S4060-1]
MRKHLIVFVLLFTLSGCLYETMYKNADRLALNRLEGIVELSDAQEQYFLVSFNAFQLIHQKEYMPEYLKWLKVLKNEWQSLDESQLKQLADEVQGHWHEVTKRINEPTLTLLLGLEEQQKQQLMSTLKERAQSRAKNTDRLERAIERFEDILGDLSPIQRSIITKYFDETEYNREVWNLHTQSRLTRLDALLALKTPLKQTERQLMAHNVFNTMDNASEHLKRVRTQWMNKQIKLLINMRETLSPSQKRHVDEFFQSWIDIVDELIKAKL